MESENSALSISIEKQKQALEIKYLLKTADQSNQSQLCSILNKVYPFTEFPVDAPPPLELIQSKQKVSLGKNVAKQLEKYSYIVLTGGIRITRRRHQYIENHFLGPESQQDIFFSLKDSEVVFELISNSSILKIYNVWIEMAKKKRKTATEKYISEKLMEIPFFANLTFQQFQKCCKTASITMLGPDDILLKHGDTPYHMYILAEGELIFQRRVVFLKDTQLWCDFKNELQREQDDTCEKMLDYLAKQPRPHQETFQVDFKIKNVAEGEIICARETLLEEKLKYSIFSTLKTKLITLKYPDLYNLESERLSEIRSWPSFEVEDKKLRLDYFYQAMWSNFKEQTKEQSKLNKLQKQKFQDFLRKKMNMNPDKHSYVPNKIGEGTIIDSSAGKVSKLKVMSYHEAK